MAKRSADAKLKTFPTQAKHWRTLRADWLSQLIQHLDNEWIIAVAEDGAEVDRPTLEAILHCAVGISPDTELGPNRHAEELFAIMLETYKARGRPLQGLPLSHFQPCTMEQLGQSTSQPGQLGSSDSPGQASQASGEGPELALTPDGLLFLRMGQQSMFLLTSVQGGADDWLLDSCSLGPLVFSQSKGMAQLVTTILACPGHCWPLFSCPPSPPPTTVMQSAQPEVVLPTVTAHCRQHVEPPASPQTPASGRGSSLVPNLGTSRFMSPMSS